MRIEESGSEDSKSTLSWGSVHWIGLMRDIANGNGTK